MAKHTMNVSLTPELEQFVQSLVESGQYASQSEVVRAGLRRLVEAEAERAAKLEALKADVRVGIEDALAGRVERLTSEEVMARVTAAYDQKMKSA